MTAASPGPRPQAARLAAAILATHVYRALAAALLALPIVSAVGASGIRSFTRGDSRLFEPGGLYLLEVAVRSRELLAESFARTALALLLLGFAGLLPEWWLVSALGASNSLSSRGLQRLGLLAVGTWSARLLLGLVTLGLALPARSYFASARDERWSLLALAVVAGLGLLAQAAISVWHDLAEVHVVAGCRPLEGAAAALRLVRAAGGSLALRYAGAVLLTGVALIGAGAAVGTLEVERGDGWRSASAFTIHQLAVLASIALRAAWLWSARRTADAAATRTRRQAEAFL